MSKSWLTFYIDSSSFVRRAREHLAAFDAVRGVEANLNEARDVEAIFHAALAVRMGIEARLYEYIHAALKGVKPEDSGIRHWRAKDLLHQLAKLNPNAGHDATLVIRETGSADGGHAFEYRAVTRKLEKFHHRMGELLHYTYFWTHPSWYANVPWHPGSVDTLVDARDVVAAAIEELDYIARGSMLSNPIVTQRVLELEQEAPAGEPADEATERGFGFRRPSLARRLAARMSPRRDSWPLRESPLIRKR
jgi:hypothetical protein